MQSKMLEVPGWKRYDGKMLIDARYLPPGIDAGGAIWPSFRIR
jgi:hypothetical protein